MKTALAAVVASLALPSLAGAAGLELTVYGGYTFPFYSQTFQYDPGPIEVPIPGVSIDQGGSFELEASGGLALAGAATLYATDGFGFEVRYDRADITVDTRSASYTVRLDLPPPFDPFLTNVALTEGTADLDAATTLSLNLKLRSRGSVEFTLSGGASRLGDLLFTIEQTVGLGVVGIDLEQDNIQIGTIGVRATAVAGTGATWGGNLGLGLQIPIGEHVALVLEGRGFYFPKRTVEWEPVLDRPLGDFEKALLERLQERLPPVEFEPWWVQATAGLAIRF